MPFNKLTDTVNQGQGPFCGAACAVYVDHWLNNTPVNPQNTANEVRAAMNRTRLTRCTDELGSTPANIATFLKNNHQGIDIYAPTEMITNWSSRPWYSTLRLGLQTCCAISWSFGFNPASGCIGWKGGTLGDDYMVIKMISKAWQLCSSEYFTAHFIVDIGLDNQGDESIMDPAGGIIRQRDQYLTGGYCGAGWASIGLDLYIYR